jgi:hypothetical protein
VLVLFACGAHRAEAQIPAYGSSVQEYGDAVYRQLNNFWLNLFGADYNHTAIYAGLSSSYVPRVMEATGEGSSTSGDTTAEVDFSDISSRAGLGYYGAYTISNRTLTFPGRKSVVTTAVSLVDAYIPYVALDAINYFSGGSSVANIREIRCDAFVEYCYEANGYAVWWPSARPGAVSILTNADDHNDAPTPPSDPSYEFSPWAQRGAPGGSFWGGSPGNTYMTRASVVALPLYQVTQVSNPGRVDVTVQARDESGIHFIACIKPGETNWTYGPTLPQHSVSDSSSWTVRITNSGTLHYAAVDNAGNAPTAAQTPAVFITVPPPDTNRPSVSISSPTSARTYASAQTVTITATASDNVGVTRVEFYDGATLMGTDLSSPYTYDWSVAGKDNGAHLWMARAYDSTENTRTSSPVTLTVSIDGTPPVVAISSPASGARLTSATVRVSGTASDAALPSSGISLVELRVNGAGWQAASGTASWSRTVSLSPCDNTIEARSLDKAGNYSSVALTPVSYTPPNTAPSKPSNVSPATAAAGLSVTPTLQATPFADPDCVGDTHAASQWQVMNSSGGGVVADSGTDPVNRVAWTVPAGKLSHGGSYQWHVRYQDSRGAWSSYSPLTTFTTGGPLLSGMRQGTVVILRWPSSATGFRLQWSASPGARNWSNALPAPVTVNGEFTVTNRMTNSVQFYRLTK